MESLEGSNSTLEHVYEVQMHRAFGNRYQLQVFMW